MTSPWPGLCQCYPHGYWNDRRRRTTVTKPFDHCHETFCYRWAGHGFLIYCLLSHMASMVDRLHAHTPFVLFTAGRFKQLGSCLTIERVSLSRSSSIFLPLCFLNRYTLFSRCWSSARKFLFFLYISSKAATRWKDGVPPSSPEHIST